MWSITLTMLFSLVGMQQIQTFEFTMAKFEFGLDLGLELKLDLLSRCGFDDLLFGFSEMKCQHQRST